MDLQTAFIIGLIIGSIMVGVAVWCKIVKWRYEKEQDLMDSDNTSNKEGEKQ